MYNNMVGEITSYREGVFLEHMEKYYIICVYDINPLRPIRKR